MLFVWRINMDLAECGVECGVEEGIEEGIEYATKKRDEWAVIAISDVQPIAIKEEAALYVKYYDECIETYKGYINDERGD
jgi:hypothetical protein